MRLKKKNINRGLAQASLLHRSAAISQSDQPSSPHASVSPKAFGVIPMEINLLGLSYFVLSAGVVGLGTMGIAEGFKASKGTPLGFKKLGESPERAVPMLSAAYGKGEYQELLQPFYSLDRSGGELPRILRQGVCLGLTEDNAGKAEVALLGVDSGRLPAIVKQVADGQDLEHEERNILRRYEVAADARIDASLSLAERSYVNGIRSWASSLVKALSPRDSGQWPERHSTARNGKYELVASMS